MKKKIKNKMFALTFLIFFVMIFFFVQPFENNNVLADIDTITYSDDFEERYYNHIYSQYENATVTQNTNTTTFRPNGVGDITQLTPVGDTPNWKCVDEETPDEDTTRVLPLVNDYYDTYELEDHTTETGDITNVRVYVRTKKDASSPYEDFRTVTRIDSTNYYGSITALTTSYTNYYTDYATNPDTALSWTWTDIDNLQVGIMLSKIYSVSPRATQVFINVTYNLDVVISSSTEYKIQDRSFIRAYEGLYSYFHNITQNYTAHGELISHNSSIVIDFVSLHVFPRSMTFFIFANFEYNVSLFIGNTEYSITNNTGNTLNSWDYISIMFRREEYIINSLDLDFYIKIYPIANNNTVDTCYMDNLRVKYTDAEPKMSFDTWCLGGSSYDDWAIINASTSSFYASNSGENPAGWIKSGDSVGWAYELTSNAVMSRGMEINNLWTLRGWTSNNLTLNHITELNFTIDKDYYIKDYAVFTTGQSVSEGYPKIFHSTYVYEDDILTYESYNWTLIGDMPIVTGYYELSYLLNLAQLNEETISISFQFDNYYGNTTDYRPLIFQINEDIQSGLNIMQYKTTTYYTSPSATTNPTIYQKASRDIHNSPFDDIIDRVGDSSGIGAFFRNIWQRIQEFLNSTESGTLGIIWQLSNMQASYSQQIISELSSLAHVFENNNWMQDFINGMQELEDTFAGGMVGTWRNMFENNNFEGLNTRWYNRYGSLVERSARGENSIFTRIFSGIFGESVSWIPQLIFEFFNNIKNWIVILFIMYIIWLMRSVMARDWDRVRRELGFFIKIITYIIKLVQWLITFVIKIITMIGSFIPFT